MSGPVTPLESRVTTVNEQMTPHMLGRTKAEEHLIKGVSTALLNTKKAINTTMKNTQMNHEGHSIDMNYKAEFQVCDQTFFQKSHSAFDMPKLRKMVKTFGEFPEKYRTLTWKYLLQLPLNRQAFQALIDRGVHPAFKSLHRRFPVDSYRLYNKLVRILSVIGHWSPIFLEVDWLP